jgi:hypothetical protein
MADEGVMAPLNQYVQVYQNGQFYGLYGMIEDVSAFWGVAYMHWVFSGSVCYT